MHSVFLPPNDLKFHGAANWFLLDRVLVAIQCFFMILCVHRDRVTATRSISRIRFLLTALGSRSHDFVITYYWSNLGVVPQYNIVFLDVRQWHQNARNRCFRRCTVQSFFLLQIREDTEIQVSVRTLERIYTCEAACTSKGNKGGCFRLLSFHDITSSTNSSMRLSRQSIWDFLRSRVDFACRRFLSRLI